MAVAFTTQREVGIDTDSYAISFAETRHLCLLTIHANNDDQMLDRMINFFNGDRREQVLIDLSLNLKAVVAQRLIQKKGKTGRIVAVEIMLNTPLISSLIGRGNVFEIRDVMKRSRELGMQTFDQAVYDLYKTSEITCYEALRNAGSVYEVRLMVKLDTETGEVVGEEGSSDLSMQSYVVSM
jgi:twitching motility protein PilU